MSQNKTKSVASVKAPVLPPINLLRTISNLQFEEECEYSQFQVSQVDASNQTTVDAILRVAYCDKLRLSNCNLRKLRTLDVVFDKSDLSNCYFSESKFTRAELRDCKLTGLKIIDGDLIDVKFQRCSGELVQFQGTAFKSVIFDECKLPKADFRFCNLENAILVGCDLSGAIFYDAKLAGADLRRSNLDGIQAHPKDLRGAIITSQQAMDLAVHFARLLEIDVRNE